MLSMNFIYFPVLCCVVRNENALKFYSHIGAIQTKEWIPIRLTHQGMDEFTEKFGKSSQQIIVRPEEQ
jgi:hypothetical protein